MDCLQPPKPTFFWVARRGKKCFQNDPVFFPARHSVTGNYGQTAGRNLENHAFPKISGFLKILRGKKKRFF